jgi:hypothetical protein
MSRDAKPSYYPLSLVALCVWVVYIAGVFAILEITVRYPEDAYKYYITASPFLTVFSQGHMVVTGMHLSRLGVSALQDPRLAPRTWLEMFWFTSGNWRSPGGWATTFLHATKRRLRLSLTYLLFVLPVIFAMAAPLLLQRAYPVTVVNIIRRNDTELFSLANNDSNHLDPLTQVNIGQSAWLSDEDVDSNFEGGVYYPVDQSDPNDLPREIVFSAITDLDDVPTAPSLRLQGSCQPLDEQDTESGQSITVFESLCAERGLGRSVNATFDGLNITASFESCSNLNALTAEAAARNYWAIAGQDRTEHALVWLSMTDYDKNNVTQGIIECFSDLQSGTAHIWTPTDDTAGAEVFQSTFENFAPKDLFKADLSSDRAPFWPPLFTAINVIALPINGTTNDSNTVLAQTERLISAARMLGFTYSIELDRNGQQLWQKPTLKDAASALFSGAINMAGGIYIAAGNEINMEASWEDAFPGRERAWVYLGCAIGVLAAWLIALLALTALFFRRTFAGSMDTYTVARIAHERPDLLEDRYAGELADNPKMSERFDIASMVRANGSFLSKKDTESERRSLDLQVPVLAKSP